LALPAGERDLRGEAASQNAAGAGKKWIDPRKVDSKVLRAARDLGIGYQTRDS
jgi:hypothetical protein